MSAGWWTCYVDTIFLCIFIYSVREHCLFTFFTHIFNVHFLCSLFFYIFNTLENVNKIWTFKMYIIYIVLLLTFCIYIFYVHFLCTLFSMYIITVHVMTFYFIFQIVHSQFTIGNLKYKLTITLYIHMKLCICRNSFCTNSPWPRNDCPSHPATSCWKKAPWQRWLFRIV